MFTGIKRKQMKKIRKLKDTWITQTKDSRLYNIPVPIIGLTGGIATGKSSVAELFRQDGIPVIDADKLVKTIYQTPEAFDFISTHFPEAIENNLIEFKRLREKVFSKSENQKKVEEFIYQRLPLTFKQAYDHYVDAPFIVYDVPLLFEKNIYKYVDITVCVYAPKTTQLKRLINRDHISVDLAEKIISKQMDIEEKKNKSKLFIDNSESLDRLKINYEILIDQLLSND